jgi:integrase
MTMTESRALRPYRPQMAPEKWEAMAPYVHDIVSRAGLQVTYTARQLYPAVTRLVEFATDNHVPLEDGTVFDPLTIGRFINHHFAGYNRASRNTMRARLRRVSEALLGDEAEGRFKALGKAEASRPYSLPDIASLEAWSRAQTSEERRTSASALLSLGLGAGLTGSEIVHLRATHVENRSGTFVVQVAGDHPRQVPVLAAWTNHLENRLTFLGGDGWVFRSDQHGGNINLITDFVSRSGKNVPLQARRMRATWIVHHLEAGTSLKRLLRIAGLQSAEAFDRILPFVTE